MFAMETKTLQQELMDLLMILQTLNPVDLNTLCRFLQHTKEDLLVGQLIDLVRSAPASQIDRLVASSSASPTGLPTAQLQEDKPYFADDTDDEGEEETEGDRPFGSSAAASSGSSASTTLRSGATDLSASSSSSRPEKQLPKELVSSFQLLIQLYHLHQLLSKLSILQIMKIFEFVPPGSPQVQQLQLLQQLQQLLGQLLPETLVSLHQELEATPQAGPEQHQVLSQLLQLRKEHFHLYQPLRMLLQLETEELLGMQDILPKLQPMQMLQLLALLQLQPFDVLELKRIFQPANSSDIPLSELLVAAASPEEGESESGPSSLHSSTSGTRAMQKRDLLRIVEQPPEKSVYKRNLKPNPTVQLGEEDELSMDTNLYVAPVLIRCDTLEDKPKLLTGNKPVKITPGRAVTFRRLKIMATSHQQGESLFALKFELRRYQGNEYQLLDFVQSNPVCVLSHSTQLRPASSTTASVTEVIPYSGSTLGGTRVAVLGNNFVDSPSARVRFDNIDVMPTFHGPRTLICNTPMHQPGIVSVRVSNDSKVWSPTAASFTYEEKKSAPEQAAAQPVRSRFDLGLDIASSICEAAWQGGFDTVRELTEDDDSDLDETDDRGFGALHYASANGHDAVVTLLLERGADPNLVDDSTRNLSVLQWTVLEGQLSTTQLLLQNGADPNLMNEEGLTALHIAAELGRDAFITLLLQNGASASPYALDGETPLHKAASYGQVEAIRILLEHGAHGNARDLEGDTPVHCAVRHSHNAALEGLLSARIDGVFSSCDAGMRNEDGETPLHFSILAEDPVLTKTLLTYGANPDVRDRIQAQTPLHLACIENNAAVASLLLNSGASALVKDIDGNLPLHLCMDRDQAECASAIILYAGKLPLSLSDPATTMLLMEHPSANQRHTQCESCTKQLCMHNDNQANSLDSPYAFGRPFAPIFGSEATLLKKDNYSFLKSSSSPTFMAKKPLMPQGENAFLAEYPHSGHHANARTAAV